jgi:hypothetical protein
VSGHPAVDGPGFDGFDGELRRNGHDVIGLLRSAEAGDIDSGSTPPTRPAALLF